MQSRKLTTTGHGGEVEDSLSMRIVTSAMAITGILAASPLAETPSILVAGGIAGIIAGSAVSYIRRRSNNFWLKWGISLGILIVAGVFFQELLERIRTSVADARMPLTNMLIALQSLHCFDMPRRRDLNLSALVGLTLMSSAATLSRDTGFGIYLLSFLILSSYMLHLDCISRTRSRARVGNLRYDEPSEAAVTPEEARPALGPGRGTSRAYLIPSVILLPLCGFLLFLSLPRAEITFLRHISVSARLNLPWLKGDSIVNRDLLHDLRPDGSIAVNPRAYFGFAEDLNLNYRGQLDNEIMMRVSSLRGVFWRAMAFDTYDGHHWTMSEPHKVEERLAYCGSEIPLSPMPSCITLPSTKTFELNQVFYIEADMPNVVPVASVPFLLQFPAQMVKVDHYGGIRCASTLEKDTVYTALSRVPQFDLPKLRQMPPEKTAYLERVQDGLANYLQLPASLPASVRQLSGRITAGDGNWYCQAERINNFLQSHYVYDLNVPATPANADVVADFLERQKRGYCEHFASAFVVLCRCRGIPARLVTGFTEGEYNPLTGLWEVRLSQAHAWAEVFIPHSGWISFDPTAQGVEPGYCGSERQSPIDYIVEHLRPILATVLAHPSCKATCHAFEQLFFQIASRVAPCVPFLSALWRPLAAVLSLVIIVSALLALRQRWRSTIARKLLCLTEAKSDVESNEKQRLRKQATQCYQNVLKELLPLKICRQENDTSSDLIASICARLESPPASADQDKLLKELLPDLTCFMEQYEKTRFGRSPAGEELTETTRQIHDKLERMS